MYVPFCSPSSEPLDHLYFLLRCFCSWLWVLLIPHPWSCKFVPPENTAMLLFLYAETLTWVFTSSWYVHSNFEQEVPEQCCYFLIVLRGSVGSAQWTRGPLSWEAEVMSRHKVFLMLLFVGWLFFFQLFFLWMGVFKFLFLGLVGRKHHFGTGVSQWPVG